MVDGCGCLLDVACAGVAATSAFTPHGLASLFSFRTVSADRPHGEELAWMTRVRALSPVLADGASPLCASRASASPSGEADAPEKKKKKPQRRQKAAKAEEEGEGDE